MGATTTRSTTPAVPCARTLWSISETARNSCLHPPSLTWKHWAANKKTIPLQPKRLTTLPSSTNPRRQSFRGSRVPRATPFQQCHRRPHRPMTHRMMPQVARKINQRLPSPGCPTMPNQERPPSCVIYNRSIALPVMASPTTPTTSQVCNISTIPLATASSCVQAQPNASTQRTASCSANRRSRAGWKNPVWEMAPKLIG